MDNQKPKRRRFDRSELKTDKDWLIGVGEALFGPRWQRDLADLCGISAGHMSGIMNDKKTLSPKTKSALVNALEYHRNAIMDDATYRIRMVGETIAHFSN